MGKPKAKSDGAKDKRVPGKWIHYLNKYRTDNSNVFEKTKDGNLALIREAAKTWKTLTKEEKDAYNFGKGVSQDEAQVKNAAVTKSKKK